MALKLNYCYLCAPFLRSDLNLLLYSLAVHLLKSAEFSHFLQVSCLHLADLLPICFSFVTGYLVKKPVPSQARASSVLL